MNLTEHLSCVELERKLGPGLLQTRAVTFVRGEGAALFDETGRRYIDCAAAHGAAALGHGHPAVARALFDQARRLSSCTPSFANDERAAYLRELAAVLPFTEPRVFLCNSGTEAVEAALKFARLSTTRTQVVACVRGFHGRTLGALSATWEPRYRTPFEPLVPGFSHVPFNDAAALESAVGEQTACVVLEPVQGESGVRPAQAEFLQAAERICRERGALLVLDEVQTGFGRTGRLFALEHFGVTPDLLCLGKGIAAGLPMAAVAIGPRVAKLPIGSHGSTFGGSPLLCAVARVVLRTLIESRLPEHAAELGELALGRLRTLPGERVRAVRGLGLMLGVELREKVQPALDALLERGIIALAAGTHVLRLLPPLVIERSDLEAALDGIEKVLA